MNTFCPHCGWPKPQATEKEIEQARTIAEMDAKIRTLERELVRAVEIKVGHVARVIKRNAAGDGTVMVILHVERDINGAFTVDVQGDQEPACTLCRGTGEVEETRPVPPSEATGGLSEETRHRQCPRCHGTGQDSDTMKRDLSDWLYRDHFGNVWRLSPSYDAIFPFGVSIEKRGDI